MALRVWIAIVTASLCLASGFPDFDVRNVELPDPKTHFRMPSYKSRAEWLARKDQLRKQILSAAGLLPMPAKNPLRAMILKTHDRGDYSIQVVLLETFPGYYVGGNLYRPLHLKGPAPAVLIPHGHWKGGRLENLPSYSVPALGINLARQGYVAFAYDMAGYNDTRQTPHDFSGWQEDLWSFHPMGLQLWNSIRAIDYLESLRDVDSKRIAMTGASGGGTQTFLLTAVDDRIRYVAPVNMVSAYMQGGDPCEEAPGLRNGAFNVEFAAMAAPRPMLVVSSTRDWTRHTPIEEFPAIRKIYSLFGAASVVHNVHIEAEHNYNRESREAVYRFFAENLHPERPNLKDQDVDVPPDSEMLAFSRNEPVPNLPGFDEVFERWRASSVLQMQSVTDVGQLRESLSYALGAVWPAHVDSRRSGERIVLTGTGAGDRVTGRWFPGKGKAVLVVHPLGVLAGVHMNVTEEARKAGRPVLVLEPFRNSPTRAARQQADTYFLSYNRTDASLRVQDILTALAFLKAQVRGTPEVVGLGEAGPWTVFAAAVAPVRIDVLADLDGFGGSDEDFRNRFYVPGIQRSGGLMTALRINNHTRAAFETNPQQTTGPGVE